MAKIIQQLAHALLDGNSSNISHHVPTSMAIAAGLSVKCCDAQTSMRQEASEMSLPKSASVKDSQEIAQSFSKNEDRAPKGCMEASRLLDSLTNNPDTDNAYQSERTLS